MTVSPGADEHQVGRERRGRHPVEEHDVVALGSPAQVLERQGPDAVAVERGGQLVVEEARLARRGGQPALEPGEIEDGVGAILPDAGLDDCPGAAELSKIVLRAGDDGAPRVGKPRRVRIAESIARDLTHGATLRGDRAMAVGGCQRARGPLHASGRPIPRG